MPKLFGDLALARGDGRYLRVLRALGGVKLLILDDWGLEPLDPQARHDLLEILEERWPALDHRHQPTARRQTARRDRLPDLRADTILDRLVHNAHRIDLTGDSLRRKRASKKRLEQLTPASARCQKSPASEASALGNIISECPGSFIGISIQTTVPES